MDSLHLAQVPAAHLQQAEPEYDCAQLLAAGSELSARIAPRADHLHAYAAMPSGSFQQMAAGSEWCL